MKSATLQQMMIVVLRRLHLNVPLSVRCNLTDRTSVNVSSDSKLSR